MKPGTPESREAQLREHAMSLARDLSKCNFREVCIKEGKNLRSGVNPKMKELMDIVTELEGQTTERPVGEDGVVWFKAGDPSKSWGDAGRLHSLMFSTRDEKNHKDEKVLAFIDSVDGGSLIMGDRANLPAPNDPAWTKDDEFEEDCKYILKERGFIDSTMLAGLNRFRELRLAARMAYLLLGAKEIKNEALQNPVEMAAEKTRKDIGDVS